MTFEYFSASLNEKFFNLLNFLNSFWKNSNHWVKVRSKSVDQLRASIEMFCHKAQDEFDLSCRESFCCTSLCPLKKWTLPRQSASEPRGLARSLPCWCCGHWPLWPTLYRFGTRTRSRRNCAWQNSRPPNSRPVLKQML